MIYNGTKKIEQIMLNNNEVYYANDLERKESEGSNITLNNVIKGKMTIQPKGNTSQAILPSEYQQVEYIESSGTQYIDTGIAGNTSKRIQAKLNWSLITNNDSMFIGANSGSGTSIVYISAVLISNLKRVQFAYGSYTNMSQTIVENTDYELDAILSNGSQTVKLNDDVGNNNLSANIGAKNLYLFAMNSNGNANYYSSGKLYFCKIYDTNDVLVRNLIPCYRKSDSVIGLYDLVTNTFYTNQGTGTFTKGNDVPNPNYPQEIKNVTGDNNVVIRGKNLVEEIIQNSTVGSDGTLTYTSQNNTAIAKVKKGKTYIISMASDTLVYGLYTSKPTLNSVSYNNSRVVTTTTPFTITPTITGYIAFRLDLADTTPQLEEGSSATTYEPYIRPIEKELKLSGKNLFDVTKVTNNKYVDENNGELVSYNNVLATDFIEVQEGKKYYFSGMTTLNNGNTGAMYDENKNYVNKIHADTNIQPLTIPNGVKYIRLSIWTNNYENPSNPAVMLEQGSTPTSYEPYYNYTLSKIGDYQDIIFKNEPNNVNYDNTLVENGWYKKNVIGKTIIDEKTSWGKGSIISGYSYFYTSEFDNIINSIYNAYCDKMVVRKNMMINQTPVTTDTISIGGTDSAKIRIKILSSRLNSDTQAAFQDWLKDNNLIICLILATPTYTQITETTLIEQLESLNRKIIPSGTIVIETESTNAQLIVNANYVAKKTS